MMSRCLMCCFDHSNKTCNKYDEVVVPNHEPTDRLDAILGMGATDRKLVKDTSDVVFMQLQLQTKSVAFLIAFFKKYPHHQHYFKMFRDVPPDELWTLPQVENHGRRVMDQMLTLVQNMDEPDLLQEQLAWISTRHKPRRVRARQFKDMLAMFVEFTGHELGARFTSQHEQAWHKWLAFILSSIEKEENKASMLTNGTATPDTGGDHAEVGTVSGEKDMGSNPTLTEAGQETEAGESAGSSPETPATIANGSLHEGEKTGSTNSDDTVGKEAARTNDDVNVNAERSTTAATQHGNSVEDTQNTGTGDVNTTSPETAQRSVTSDSGCVPTHENDAGSVDVTSCLGAAGENEERKNEEGGNDIKTTAADTTTSSLGSHDDIDNAGSNCSSDNVDISRTNESTAADSIDTPKESASNHESSTVDPDDIDTPIESAITHESSTVDSGDIDTPKESAITHESSTVDSGDIDTKALSSSSPNGVITTPELDQVHVSLEETGKTLQDKTQHTDTPEGSNPHSLTQNTADLFNPSELTADVDVHKKESTLADPEVSVVNSKKDIEVASEEHGAIISA